MSWNTDIMDHEPHPPMGVGLGTRGPRDDRRSMRRMSFETRVKDGGWEKQEFAGM